MSINSAESDDYRCEYCGADIDAHDLAGRCPTAAAFGESLEDER